jgi:hypothetical protein
VDSGCSANGNVNDCAIDGVLRRHSGLYRVLAGRFADDIAADVDPVEVTIRALPAGSD